MSAFDFCSVTWSSSGIEITADTEIVDFLKDELEKVFPTKFGFNELEKSFATVRIVRIHSLKGQDSAVAAWLIRILGQKGWEPFAQFKPNELKTTVSLKLQK